MSFINYLCFSGGGGGGGEKGKVAEGGGVKCFFLSLVFGRTVASNPTAQVRASSSRLSLSL